MTPVSLRLLAFFLILPAAALYCQEKRLSLTLHAGPVVSTIKAEPDFAPDAKWRSSFSAGASLNWQQSEYWFIPVTVQFSQRGFYLNTEATYIVVDNQPGLYRGRIDYRLSYLDVLPQIAFRPVKHLSIAAGPYLSWRLGESVRYGEVIDWTSTKDNALFSDTDFGLNGRLGVHFGPVSLFASYLFGLSSISPNITLTDENGLPVGELSAKTRGVSVAAGYTF